MSLSRLAKATRAIDLGARRELRKAGCNPDSLTLAIHERGEGAIRVHASFDLPADKVDALAALVDAHEPDLDAEHH